ncbi:hypothetical protein EEB12_24520 [Rhodococcus sp. WS1]|uniref:hypothetical protein n=1 Tax=Rhodococcus TaxID=1827 RepID=UPI0011418A01|nr:MULTISPECIES: hypothetical protein [unclassified Rhodococcus (in: high G+C Gram-positive bacteria)]ROZ56813.1 hypothetical protein EEB12_24520 [Rhodococcus sp. WS1]TQC41020.1 hypothetical protein EEB16_04725 [Rhodococcus sp. WS7]
MGNARRVAKWVIASKDLLGTLALLEDFGHTYLDENAELPIQDYTVFTPSSNNLFDTPDLERAIERLGEQPNNVNINFKRPQNDPLALVREVQYSAHVIHVKQLVTIELVVLGQDSESMDQFFAHARDALDARISELWPETIEEFEASAIGVARTPTVPRRLPSVPQSTTRPTPPATAPDASTAKPDSKRTVRERADAIARHPLWSALIAALVAGLIIFALTALVT